MFRRAGLFALAVLVSSALSVPAAPIPTPSALLEMEIGADRVLADYRQIVSYFRMLESSSPRVEIVDLGPTTLGESMIMAVISSEENIRNLDRIREISRRLADPRGLGPEQVETLVREGKAVVLVTCNIHSTEIASSQMAMEWAHALATADDPVTRARLENVVLLLVPSLNPDGQIMETEWYRKYRGTRFEGGRMPWLYHHYVGHDNNRDWFMLTQNETRNMTRAIYHEWLPQVFVDEHQMGPTGPRMFIPPFSDPLDPDVHPLIWREINLIGSNMAFRLEQQGKSGLIYGYSYDAYWVGGTRNTGWWKNVTGLLLEVASARMASPIEVHRTELRGGRKGLVEYKAQINHPNPWPGGLWRMRDIMDYERIASDALLEIVAERRVDFLRNVVERARSAVAMAAPREAYLIPRDQRDPATARRLALLLADHGVEVFETPDGDHWVPLAQPFARFVREMLEPQRYPEVRPMAGSDILRPYDVATWTLPLMMGVRVEKARMPAISDARKVIAPITLGERLPPFVPKAVAEAPWFAVLPSSAESVRVINAALRSPGMVLVSATPASDLAQAPVPVEFPPGTVWLDRRAADAARETAARSGVDLIPATSRPDGATRLRAPRVGIYKPWLASMDEGWTRWLLEEYGFRLETLDNESIRKAAASGGRLLRERFDAIILPDLDPAIIAEGRPERGEGSSPYRAELPPEYAGGLGEPGALALAGFVERGGTLVAFDSSTGYAIEQLKLPVRNALAETPSSEFENPGSLVRAHVEPGHPIVWGSPSELAIFLDDNVAFETVIPAVDVARRVLLTYPDEGRDVLLSGWMRGADRLERKAAAVALGWKGGKVVLFGFRPQHRGQTHGTFPLLFQSLYWSVAG
ncbi:MAG TPA: M14 metallopeptidase family protein [Thermoanaerobaculia bacterium]|nr:M14 metallopeptidase family protein [Thermoanaerobaculia bacterium]